MPTPRFLFVGCQPLGGAPAQWWLGQPTLTGVGVGGAWTAWRLVGANNRELGRSGRSFPDEQACRADAAEVAARVVGAEPVLCGDLRLGGWTWRIGSPDEPIAVAGRPYPRQREALYNASQFLALVSSAVLTDGVFVLPRPDSRRAVVTLPRQSAGGHDGLGVVPSDDLDAGGLPSGWRPDISQVNNGRPRP